MINKQTCPKIAVVGTGAAAFGVLTALLNKHSKFELVVFDIGKEIAKASPPDNPSEEWIVSFYDKVYEEIRSLYGFKFPLPKTHLGKGIPRQPVGQHLSIFKSESFGGLTNYWGATMLPFTAQEMAKWPISEKILYPYYQKIAEIAGLAARPDALNEYFIRDFSTRPPIRPIPALNYLNEIVNHHKDKGEFKIISGLNRCAVEIRNDHPNHCVYCGECMAGCFRDAVYSTRLTIKQYLKDPRVKYYNKAEVKRIIKKGSLEIQLDKNRTETGFSKVFLCAGCPSSTEIIMRSLGLRNRLTMTDNAVYVFPIFYLGKKPSQVRPKSYLSLCNLILGCIPKTNEHFAQVQIYPNFDYLWRCIIPSKLWPIARAFISHSRSRMFWGRLYLHSDYSQTYSLELKNDKLFMDEAKQAEPGELLKELMSNIRATVNHKGFYIPPIPPIRQKVNSHYAGTLPFNGKLLKVSSAGQVMPNVYLCDSACFPDTPAVNPAFTIMANAFRIADEALNQ